MVTTVSNYLRTRLTCLDLRGLVEKCEKGDSKIDTLCMGWWQVPKRKQQIYSGSTMKHSWSWQQLLHGCTHWQYSYMAETIPVVREMHIQVRHGMRVHLDWHSSGWCTCASHHLHKVRPHRSLQGHEQKCEERSRWSHPNSTHQNQLILIGDGNWLWMEDTTITCTTTRQMFLALLLLASTFASL